MDVEKHLNWARRFPRPAANFLSHTRLNPLRQLLKWKVIEYNVTAGEHIVLEVGFGSGYEYYRIKHELGLLNAIYIGLEYTPKFVRSARRRYPEATWIQGDARTLTFKDNSIGITFLCHVLEHQKNLDNLKKVISELCRVTMSVIIILWFKPPSLTQDTTYIMDGNFFEYRYSIGDVAEIIEQNGFMIKEIIWQNNLSKYANDCLWILEKQVAGKHG